LSTNSLLTQLLGDSLPSSKSTNELLTDLLNAVCLPNPAALPRGTKFPSSPATGDLFYRTDLGVLCEWDGARWLGGQRQIPLVPWVGAGPWSANASALLVPAPGATIIASINIVAHVATTNSATNYWILEFLNILAAIGSPMSTAANSPGVMIYLNQSFGEVAANNYLFLQLTKSGSPGSIYASALLTYRIVYYS
jgi:hypothetical protein